MRYEFVSPVTIRMATVHREQQAAYASGGLRRCRLPGERGMFTYRCDRPKSHEGDHRTFGAQWKRKEEL